MADLDLYRAKRDFAATPEPEGKAKGGAGRRKGRQPAPEGLFVVQKHAARRLHYDFRLEMGGVLKSWAVTRGPSLVPGEKRLAVHVEDHPLAYAGFEGTIPKGEYGGGSVIVWDRGTWTPVGDPHAAYAKGHMEFTLDGEKLHGRWHLVRMAPRGRGTADGKKDNWLLIKADDDAARPEGAPDVLDELPLSVLSGRDIADLSSDPPPEGKSTPRARSKPKVKAAPAGAAPAQAKAAPPPQPDPPVWPKGAKAAPLPDFVPPALATLATRPPAGQRYVHEIKFDGYRIEARIAGGRVRLLTRTGLDWTHRFGPEVLAVLAALPVREALIDGEMVVESGNGASDFSALQADLSDGRTDRFLYCAFDLLHLDGMDLTGAALVERKAALERLIPPGEGKVRFSIHFEDDGSLVLQHACRLSLEGVVSKLKNAPYRSGRSRDWIKSKCSDRQEFVIGGFVPSTTTRDAIGSLVLGAFEDGKLRHVGRVGTGFTARVAADLHALLAPDAVAASPFSGRLPAEAARGVTFVKPVHVAEVEFRSWTGDGHLRHAAFRGLRDDKPAAEVEREAPPPAAAKNTKDKTAEEEANPPRRRVRLTHPDRIYWPDVGLTKEGLADYYAEVWRHMAPFVAGRPLALVRCPEGIDGPRFFQKHPWKGLDRTILLVPDPQEPKAPPYVAVRDLDGLTALVQGAVLEIHPFGSTIADWERPDTLIMDLDPGDGVGWPAVLAAAAEVRARLEKAGLAAFVKTSGGKGLHVCAPLTPKADWAAAKAFTKAMAEAMATDSPTLYVATIAKARRTGRILVDYLRNQRGQTAVAPYSTRARPGAPVSMPLAWEELSTDIGPAHFTALNALTRLENLSADPWADFRRAAVPLPG
ncbi:DNA ligase D [Xanthobacter dioxanivorans]|uniref:DNA ligase (ATP) n=1 Tax=Xanthobacter dioxanivorans TaxID=2528964 RepID=A0A974PKP2_9HYPH|nr:DNA ligase D [Xanthobacter dioxanivorans]QRG04954.1 DNA ligase D [Xanthobacter dioxanivorans]